MSKKQYCYLDWESGMWGVREGKTTQNPTQLKKTRYETTLINKLFNITFNRFDWKNLPEPINIRILEKLLFYRGYAAIGQVDGTFLALQASPIAAFNEMFDPMAWNVVGYNISGTMDFTNSVLVRNDYNAYPSIYMILYYLEQISRIQSVIDQNLDNMRAPYLIKTSEDNLLSVKNMFNQIRSGEPAIYLNKQGGVNMDDIDVLDLSTPDVIKTLYDLKLSTENELLTMFGINNENINKQSGISEAEVESNDGEVANGYIDAMLYMRQEACEQMNKLWGLNVSCELKKNEKNLKEVDINGEVHNDTAGPED